MVSISNAFRTPAVERLTAASMVRQRFIPLGPRNASTVGLRGRRAETEELDRLVAAAKDGKSRALVLRGEAGVGKSALLDYVSGQADACRVVRATGLESESELAFAGLHQLCAPFVDGLDRLPVPQHDALGTALGLRTGDLPDRFLVGLAVLSLFADVAEEQPLVCLIDDVQWLDRASTQVLSFVARRLASEGIVLVLALRESGDDPDLAGLMELTVEPLSDADARLLLASATPGRLDEPVCNRIIAEARGNPRALLELPRASAVGAYGSGFEMPGTVRLSGRIAENFRRRFARLPAHTRRLLLIAAADPVGDAALVRAAAEGLGVAAEAAEPATAAGLLDDGTRLRFRDPLVRSVVYWTATPADRQLVHAALAEATDREIDPDRRAWHRAQAAPGPDEAVAAELERSASRAQRRGGLAAAAAFLQRAVELTRDTNRRSERALSASQASLHAGAFDAALTVLAATDARRLNEVQRVSADLLRGQVEFASTVGSDAPPLLLKAAKRLESIDLDHARETYLEAWGAALFAGGFATTGSLLEVSQAARLLPPPSHPPGPSDLLLDGLTLLVTEGRAAAAGTLRKATRAFVAGDISSEQNVRWGWLTTVPSHVLWDDESWQVINVHQVQFARDAGALARLPIDLTASAILEAWSGNFTGAAEAIAEAEVVTKATATKMAPYAAMLLAALRGREDQSSVIANALRDATAGGQGMGVQFANLVSAILFNGLGRYEEAQIAASRASEESPELYLSAWALPELIEASVRSGRAEEAAEALERLTEATVPSSTHWALGIHARSRAVLSNGELAESSYLEAIDHLAQTRLRIELARAHLLYGEWLRRENRRVDARQQLYAAHEMFSAIGVEAFTERARRELITTGETVRKRTFETLDELTPQEAAIARLATDGRTNAEIAAHLFLSPRTVEWHLGKVFRKLGVASRRDLALGSDQRSRGSRSEHQYRGAVFVP